MYFSVSKWILRGFFYRYSAETALDPYRAVTDCSTDIVLGAKFHSSQLQLSQNQSDTRITVWNRNPKSNGFDMKTNEHDNKGIVGIYVYHHQNHHSSKINVESIHVCKCLSYIHVCFTYKVLAYVIN